MKVLITGGSGYIGVEVVKKLKDYDVTILSRNPKAVEGIKTINCNLLNKELLKEKIKNFDLIIHSAGIVRSLNKDSYKENIQGTKNLIEAMYFNKIKKIIYFSTQYVYSEKAGPYGSSKKEAEKVMLASNLDYVILRPNFVYGVDKRQYYLIAQIAKKTRLNLIIGNGKTKLQPINVEDVANITLETVKNFKPKSTLDLSGADAVSFNDIASYIKESLNKKCINIHIPMFIFKIFKKIVPFDVDSLTSDKVMESKNNLKLTHNIRDDIKAIVNLK